MQDWFEWRDLPKADFAVIGDPIAHSRSPVMHNAVYTSLSLPHRYVAVRVPEEDFSEAMNAFEEAQYIGLNVTVPLKEQAFRWTHGGDSRMGAVNTIRLEDRSGINTDSPGFLRTLDDLGIRPCKVLVLGAGGSARAVCVGLHDACFEVSVYNRTKERVHQMVKDSRCALEVLSHPIPKGCGLIVNATSAGITGHVPDLEWEKVDENALAYDLLYANASTPFVAEAQKRGIKAVDGKQMLIMQGALSFEWWTGQKPPIDVMLRAIS